MNRIILFLFVAVGLASCGPDLVAVAVDNPTNDYIEVSIDSLNVEIPPRDVAWVEMGHGVHVITVPGEEPVEFDFVQDMYMMNPSHSEYIMYEEIYGTMGAFASSYYEEVVLLQTHPALPNESIHFEASIPARPGRSRDLALR